MRLSNITIKLIKNNNIHIELYNLRSLFYKYYELN